MRKFAANYLVSDNGIFLKNGIVVAGQDGIVLEYIDTQGDLREIAQLIFHNGIILAGCIYVKTEAPVLVPETNHPLRSFIFQSVAKLNQFSVQNMFGLGQQVQNQFPELKISEIMHEITEVLQSNAGFSKENQPGIYLLTGVDLSALSFTAKSRLKRIL